MIIKLINKTKVIIENKPISSYFVFALISSIILNFGIFKDYAFRDAYEYIWTAKNSHTFMNEFVQGGRFLLGIICKIVYGYLCDSISDLKWVRLFSLVTSVIFSTQIFSFLLKQKLKIYETVLFSFLILTIPSFTVYIGWTATHEIPLILNIAFYSGLLLLKVPDKKKNVILIYLFALFLILICLCIYQPAATAVIIPFVLSVVISKNFVLKKAIKFIAFLGIAFIFYFLIFKLSLNWFGLEPTKRAEVEILKIPFNVILFYLKEMRTLLYGSGILIFPALFFMIGAFSFFGFFYSIFQKRTNISQFFLFMPFLILVFPLSYAPNILSSANYLCARTIAPAAVLLFFYQFIFLRELCIKKNLFKLPVLILAITIIIISSLNQNIYIAKIQNKEYLAIKKAYNNISLDDRKKIIIIKPNENFLQEFKFYKRIYADEFAQVSSSRSWVPKPMFNQILKERLDALGIKKSDFSPNDIEVYGAQEKYEENNTIVINLIEILKNEFEQN